MSNPGNTMPTTKKAVLFYNKQPLSFSDYAMYHIGADYIALYEKADNACVLCRILDEKEYPLFIVVIKRDLHNLEEVSVMMQKYRQDNRSYEDMKVFEY